MSQQETNLGNAKPAELLEVGATSTLERLGDEPIQMSEEVREAAIKLIDEQENEKVDLAADLAVMDPEHIRSMIDRARATRKPDPGMLARERLEGRMAKVRRAAARMYMILTTIVLLGIAGAVGYVYNHYMTAEAKRYTDYRMCSYVNEKHNIEVTGKREYSYRKRSLFGIEWRVSEEVDEKTVIDLHGDAITVVGLRADGTWWGRHSDDGERGILMLDDATTYIFTTEGTAGVIDYDGFCR